MNILSITIKRPGGKVTFQEIRQGLRRKRDAIISEVDDDGLVPAAWMKLHRVQIGRMFDVCASIMDEYGH